MTTKTGEWLERQPEGLLQRGQMPDFADGLRVPPSRTGVLRRRRLIELIDRATCRRVTLICAPAGTGKTAACSAWAAARSATRPILWMSLESADDQAWLWARVCSGLKRAAVAPSEVFSSLEDGPASAFPLRLVEAARLFAGPVVIVLDNVHNATGDGVLTGLDLLVRHAPPSLRLVLCGRRSPGLNLARLQAVGELAMIGPADLAAVTSRAHRGVRATPCLA